MRLVAFQGGAVGNYDDTMSMIRKTLRPWELTFRIKKEDRIAARKVAISIEIDEFLYSKRWILYSK